MEYKNNTKKDAKLAFALGGLAGSNAHGAGFLQSAQEKNIKPTLISCTSGMIWWAYNFITQKDLPSLMLKVEKNLQKLPKPIDHLSGIKLALQGIPGICRPAYLENVIDNFLFKPLPKNKDELFDRLFPARTLIPVREDKFFKEISDAFNQTDIGIMFNSYNPATGYEYIHVNEAARSLLPDDLEREYQKRLYKPITPDYVCAALWVFQYGFSRSFHGEFLIDGVYARQLIIQELSMMDSVFIARPLNTQWVGELPKNRFEVEDFKVEMLFNGSYHGEVHAMKSINYMLDKGKISPQHFRYIDIIEIEMQFNRGFFDYFFESKEVFDLACVQSKEVFDGYFKH